MYTGKFHLIDLAGSEDNRKTGNTGPLPPSLSLSHFSSSQYAKISTPNPNRIERTKRKRKKKQKIDENILSQVSDWQRAAV